MTIDKAQDESYRYNTKSVLMKVDKLYQYKIPRIILESWKQNQGDSLLPLQTQAVTKFGLLENQNLIISSPTSSGKTFCGEIAAVAKLSQRQKVIYLVPLKAVAEEKYLDFRNKYSGLGIKILISTQDHFENDLDLGSGNFDLALVIYEKFNQLLIKNIDILKQIALIIIDELQMLFDPHRGPVLELALTKVVNYSDRPQLLGLSAVLQENNSNGSILNVSNLSTWLGCKLLVEKTRPVELHQGVLYQGLFRFKKFNSGEEGFEDFLDLNFGQPLEILFANLEKLATSGEQVLVFLKSKAEVEAASLILSNRASWPKAESAIAELKELEPTTLRDKLIISLEQGVAFHNADLTYQERKIVEKFYLAGEIKVVFCTTTLSLGVNLPAKTVFVETLKYQNGETGQRSVLIPLSWSEYENISGRAGRFGKEKNFGRAVLIAASQFEASCLWENYVEGKSEALAPQLKNLGWEEFLLDLTSCFKTTSLPNLKIMVTNSFSYQKSQIDEGLLKAVTENLAQKKLLLSDEFGILKISSLGTIFALQGISVATGLYLQRKLSENLQLNSVSWVFDLLHTQEGEQIYVPLTYQEEKNKVYYKLLKQKVQKQEINHAGLKSLAENPLQLTVSDLKKLKICFLLEDWIKFVPTETIEKKYNLRAGLINQIAEQVFWLLESSHKIADLISENSELKEFLKSLAWQIKFGVPKEAIGLVSFGLHNLGRVYVQRLVQNDLADPQKISQTDLEFLKKILPQKMALELKQLVAEKLSTASTPDEKSEVDFSSEVKLEVDGTTVKNRWKVVVNQTTFALSYQSFKYLLKLIGAVYAKPEGWLHKLDLDDGDNQAKYIYRLRKELKLKAGQVIENNGAGSYRLNLKKEEIGVNKENLMLKEDEEIKRLVEKL